MMRLLPRLGLLFAAFLFALPAHAQQWVADTTANTLTTTARVGIGTPTPGSGLLLHVSSSNQVISRIENTGNGGSILDLKNPVRQWFIMSDDSPDQLRFRDATSGIDRIVIDHLGRVGVGTVSPGALLHIYQPSGNEVARFQSASANPFVSFLDNLGGTNAVIQAASGGDFVFTNNENGGIKLVSNGNEGFYQDSAGNVGIGTPTPQFLLDVYKNNTGDVARFARNSAQALVISHDGPFLGSALEYRGSADKNFDLVQNAATMDLRMVLKGTGDFKVMAGATSLSPLFTVTDQGNVGIGTPSPGTLLHVHNGIFKVSSNTGPSDLYIDAHTGNEARLSFYSANTPQWQINKTGDNTRLSFYSYALGNAVMRLHDTGKMAMGIATPSAKIHIAESAANAPVALFENTNPSFATENLFTIKGAGGPTTGSSLFRILRNNDSILHARWDGNIGIGTTVPDEDVTNATNLLAIKGGANANDEQKVGLNLGWGTRMGNGIFAVAENNDVQTSPNISLGFYVSHGGTGIGEAMRLTHQGRVGIGTPTPSASLDIGTPVADQPSLTVNIRDNRDTGALFQQGANHYLNITTTNSSEHITLGNNTTKPDTYILGSDVGIGTTSPAYKLDVAGTINAQEVLVNGQPLSASSTTWTTTGTDAHYTGGNVGIGTPTPSSQLHVSSPSQTIARIENTGGGGSMLDLKNLTRQWLIISDDAPDQLRFRDATTGVDRLVIDNQGDVGIRSADPDEALHIAGEPNPAFKLESSAPSNPYGLLQFVGSGTVPTGMRLYDGTAYSMYWNNGKVGIGVTDPQVALDVAGTIHARNDASSDFYALQLRRGQSNLSYPALFSETTNGTLILAGDTYGNGTVALNQQVGIGTTSASHQLTIDADANTPKRGVLLTQNNGSITSEWKTSGGGGTGISSSDAFNIFTGGSAFPANSRMYITAGGNVGIGTTTPGARLDLGGANGHHFLLHPSSYFGGPIISNPGGNLSFNANNVLRFSTGGTESGLTNDVIERMRIAANGNVGIGTTSPNYKLEVAGTGYNFVSRAETAGAQNLIAGLADDGQFIWQLGKDVSDNGYLQVFDGMQAQQVAITSSGDSYFNGGNVGIGTTNPTSKLAVDGTITSKEVVVTVDQAAWPDYVFADDYALRSLDEVEQFIEQEGHLPEVPSAQQVAQAGVAMGEMQATLLQKIEELTLYLIDMKQEVDSLRAELKAVKGEKP